MSNVTPICSNCAELKRQIWRNHYGSTRLGIGDYVKIPIVEGDITEYLWVVITNIDDPHLNEGDISNDPVLLTKYKYGSTISFSRNDIQSHILKGESPKVWRERLNKLDLLVSELHKNHADEK